MRILLVDDHDNAVLALREVLHYLANPLVLLLLLASAISAALGQVWSSVVIALMLALSVGLNVTQAYRSHVAARELRQRVAPTATVLRDGAAGEIPARDARGAEARGEAAGGGKLFEAGGQSFGSFLRRAVGGSGKVGVVRAGHAGVPADDVRQQQRDGRAVDGAVTRGERVGAGMRGAEHGVFDGGAGVVRAKQHRRACLGVARLPDCLQQVAGQQPKTFAGERVGNGVLEAGGRIGLDAVDDGIDARRCRHMGRKPERQPGI